MIENSNRDPNCLRCSVIVSNPTKGTRSSARIRKQRIVERQQYSEEDEDVEDPFADNSDVDSNYSEGIARKGRNTNKGRGKSANGNGNKRCRDSSEDSQVNDEDNVESDQMHSEISYRITRSGRIRRVVVTQFPNMMKKRPAPLGIELSNGIIAPPINTVYYNEPTAADKPTSIHSLNKNGITRGRDCTRVGKASHWFSLDRQFKVGKFLMYKRDKPLLNTTNLALWRIDSKSMLQKFIALRDEDDDDDDKNSSYNELSKSKGTIKFKAVKVYGGWSPLHTEDYVLVPVKVDVDHMKEDTIAGEYIVQIDSSKDLDIDSDE